MLNIKVTNKITENHLSEILKRTDFTDLTQYLDARAAADAKVLKQNKRLSLCCLLYTSDAADE